MDNEVGVMFAVVFLGLTFASATVGLAAGAFQFLESTKWTKTARVPENNPS